MASSAKATSSSFISSAFAISPSLGARESSCISSVRFFSALYAVSRIERLTLSAVLSRRYLRSSPMIIGTA